MTHRSGFVAILGRPNAGKSTLLNALTGTKLAIVASIPQTTRTAVQGVVTLKDAQMVFVDTPGIHKSTTLLNKRMMEAVRAAAAGPDVALYLVDALAPFTEEDSQAVDLVKKMEAPVIAVLNKIDQLRDKPRLLALIEQYGALHEFAAYIPISALKGEGLDVLRAEIVKRLPEGPALYPKDYLTDQPERFRAAEILREKILRLTQQEVPHSVAVVIESWEDERERAGESAGKSAGKPAGKSAGKRAGKPAGKNVAPGAKIVSASAIPAPRGALLRILATIYVERPGQKAILIGAGGASLKKIGTQARMELERLLDRKVFLQTFVKVRANWRQDPEFHGAVDWRTGQE
jgi:GTP-binding protein Era